MISKKISFIMSKTDKLLEKLKNGTIDGPESESLLKKLGWVLNRQKGSHQVWAKGNETLILIAGRRELKNYQIKDLQKALIEEE
jgi:predicted RNA binding protein YcfA (HicA-like mRNA interferase family)